jgi:DNA modification methylase
MADATAMRAVPVCRPGDTWALGDHRIHCGDASSESAFENVMRAVLADVVFVDPPYAVLRNGQVSGTGQRRGGACEDVDGFGRHDLTRTLTECCGRLSKFSKDGAIHFVVADAAHLDDLLVAGRAVYAGLETVAVWIKSAADRGSLYRSQHELIGVFKSGTGGPTNNISRSKRGRGRTNLWHYKSASTRAHEGDNVLELRPTDKPVQLVMDALCDCSKRGDIVLDSFLGHGTTLLAAERTGRICRGIERDALAVDTAIRRWQKSTGQDAVRLPDGMLFCAIESETEQDDEQ